MLKAELLAIVEQLATPIDYDDLVARGVLEKSGTAYLLRKPSELPPAAWRQVEKVSETGRGSRTVLKVKFGASVKRARSLRSKVKGR